MVRVKMRARIGWAAAARQQRIVRPSDKRCCRHSASANIATNTQNESDQADDDVGGGADDEAGDESARAQIDRPEIRPAFAAVRDTVLEERRRRSRSRWG